MSAAPRAPPNASAPRRNEKARSSKRRATPRIRGRTNAVGLAAAGSWDRPLESSESFQHLLVKMIEFLVQMRDLQFSLDVHLVLDIASDSIFFCLPVLADQHETGEEDRFQRNDHRQQAEGIRIEPYQSDRKGIDDDPDDEPDSIQDEEQHAAAEPGNPIGDS